MDESMTMLLSEFLRLQESMSLRKSLQDQVISKLVQYDSMGDLINANSKRVRDPKSNNAERLDQEVISCPATISPLAFLIVI